MNRKLLSVILTVCMLAGLFVLPAGPVGALAAEKVLYDVHYDEETGQMVVPEEDAPNTGTVDTAKKGLAISGKMNFSYYVSTVADSGKVMTLKLRITPEDTNADRYFQAHPKDEDNADTGWFNMIWFGTNGKAGFIDRSDNTNNTFDYQAGHTYLCTLVMDMTACKATATAVDETADPTNPVFSKSDLNIPNNGKPLFLNRIKNEITADGSSTILHLMQLTRMEDEAPEEPDEPEKPELGENEELLFDIYYDADSGEMVTNDDGALDYSEFTGDYAAIDTQLGGLQLSVQGADTGGDGADKHAYFMWPDDVDTTGNLVTLHMVTTMSPLNSRRWLQLYRNDGTTVDILSTTASKEVLFFNNRIDQFTFDNKKMDIRIQIDFAAKTATLEMKNLTDDEVVVESKTVEIDVDHMEKIGLMLQPKASDGQMKTILHSFYAKQEVRAPEIDPFVEITFPADGATIEPQDLNLQVSVGRGAEKVEYYSNGEWIGTAEEAPFSLVYENPGTGMYALTAKAYFSNGAVAETEKPVMVSLAEMAEAILMENDFNGKSYNGIDFSAGANLVYKPMDPADGTDYAAVITTTADAAAGAQQINYTPNPALEAAKETKIRMQADFMFSDNVVTRGLFEVRRRGGTEDDPILVRLAGGEIEVRGGSAKVPYQANKIYNIKIVLDMKTWTFDCVILEDGAEIFNETALVIGAADSQRIERVKLQQEVAGGDVTRSEMYVDNYEIARYLVAPTVTGITFATAEGGTSTDTGAAPLDTVKATLQFGTSMKAASFTDAVRLVKLPEETPVAFTGVYTANGYEMTLEEALAADSDYRVYLDGVEDTNGVATIDGYFTVFHTAKRPFGLDAFLCTADGEPVTSMADIAPGSTVSVIPTVRNETDDSMTFQVIVCVHNANGMLKGGNAGQFTLAAGETLEDAAVEFIAYDTISGTDTLSVYVWDGLRTMRALSPAQGF